MADEYSLVTDELRAAIGREMKSSEGLVLRRDFQRWASAVKDRNPLYFDDDYARSFGYREAVAPALFIEYAVTGVVDLNDLRPDGGVVGDYVPLDRCPRRLAGGVSWTFYLPVYDGDRLRARRVLCSAAEKVGRGGPFVLLSWKTSITRPDGELVAECNGSTIARPPAFEGHAGAASRRSLRSERRGSDGNTEEAGWARSPLPPPGEVDSWNADFWKAMPGEHFTSESVEIDAVQLFYFSAATHNGHRIHYDQEWAAKIEGYPSTVIHGPLQAALVARYVTRMAGAEGWLRSFAIRHSGMAYCGDVLEFNAAATARAKEESGLAVDLSVEVSSHSETLATGTATLVCPSARRGVSRE